MVAGPSQPVNLRAAVNRPKTVPLREVAKFKPQELPYPEGNYGEVFGMREKLNPAARRVDDPFGRE